MQCWLYLLDKSLAKPAAALGTKCSEGPAVSRRRMHIAWPHVATEYPDEMPLDEVQRIYRETAASTDESTMRWRGRAYLSFKARTGKYLEGEPPS